MSIGQMRFVNFKFFCGNTDEIERIHHDLLLDDSLKLTNQGSDSYWT